MNNISRWDPFRDLLTMRGAMDRLLDSSLGEQGEWSKPEWALPLDVTENENEYVVKASIPGMKPEDLDITYNNNMLTIRGETKSEEEKEDTRYHLRERRFGSFSRSITLPTSVNAGKIKASYDAGVLTLQLPKAEESKPRRIQIQSGGGQKVIEGKVSNGSKN